MTKKKIIYSVLIFVVILAGFYSKKVISLGFTGNSEGIKAAFIKVPSCKSEKSYKDLNGEWNITAIEGSKIGEAEETPFLGFNLKEGILYGSAGCNNLTGTLDTIALAKGTLSLDQVGMTRRMCANMKVEDQLVKAFPQVTNYKIKDKELTLLNKEEKVIILLEKR